VHIAALKHCKRLFCKACSTLALIILPLLWISAVGGRLLCMLGRKELWLSAYTLLFLPLLLLFRCIGWRFALQVCGSTKWF
jgi:hypothetical protein